MGLHAIAFEYFSNGVNRLSEIIDLIDINERSEVRFCSLAVGQVSSRFTRDLRPVRIRTLALCLERTMRSREAISPAGGIEFIEMKKPCVSEGIILEGLASNYSFSVSPCARFVPDCCL